MTHGVTPPQTTKTNPDFLPLQFWEFREIENPKTLKSFQLFDSVKFFILGVGSDQKLSPLKRIELWKFGKKKTLVFYGIQTRRRSLIWVEIEFTR